jgi:hypothetical protein
MRIAGVYVTGFLGALFGAFLGLFFIFQTDLFGSASRNLDPWVVPVGAAALVGLVCGVLGIVIEDRRFAMAGLLASIAGAVYAGIIMLLVASAL